MATAGTPLAPTLTSPRPVESELVISLGWLAGLRWIASAAVIVGTWVAGALLRLTIPSIPLAGIGFVIGLYNIGFTVWHRRIRRVGNAGDTHPYALARLQIAADWLAIAALAHLSGGVESPVIFYCVFHTILAALLLSERDTYIAATAAVVLLGGVAALEAWGILPHYHVPGLYAVEHYRQSLYLTSTFLFFTSTIFVSAYLTTRITRRLRAREAEMMRLSESLRTAYRQLQTVYASARDVTSTLELQEVLDRLTKSTTEAADAKGCTIRLLHETGTQLRLASSYGLREEYLHKGNLVVDQNPLVCQALSGEIVAVPDVAAEGRLQFGTEAIAEGIRSTLTAPLMGKTGPLGIIRIYCERVHCFSQEDREFIASVASHGSIAIENAMAYEAMQNLEESKRKFVLLVTHELRSPLAVVRSLLGTLSGGYAGRLTDLQQEVVDRARRRTDFLQTLIDDLLNLAAGKAGLRITGETAELDLHEVLATVSERFAVPASDRGIRLETNYVGPTSVPVTATAEELDRAVTNLISNAIKYTPQGGAVSVTLEARSGRAYLEVRDTGIGIPQESLDHLFEEFYRAPNAKSQVSQGTGLGLVITKDIITRYGGTIRVSSTEGVGTTFTVILPVSKDRTNRSLTTGRD